MTISQKEFSRTLRKFPEIEDMRNQLWDRALGFLNTGYEIEAYILILATWNFAGFRFFLKKFNLNKFRKTLKKLNPIFNKLKNKTFESIDVKDPELRKDIKLIYAKLKEIAKQTGATKIMALKNPKLFVMWDTEIRGIYKINNFASPDDYIVFLEKMKEKFKNIKWKSKKKPLAKAIDEYNYVLAERRRRTKT